MDGRCRSRHLAFRRTLKDSNLAPVPPQADARHLRGERGATATRPWVAAVYNPLPVRQK